jgi:tryptophan 2,3-dioxygenase
MSNKYLEKIAGISSSISRGVELLTGSKLTALKKAHRSLAKSKSYRSDPTDRAIVKGMVRSEASKVVKARSVAAVGSAGVASGAVAAIKARNKGTSNE